MFLYSETIKQIRKCQFLISWIKLTQVIKAFGQNANLVMKIRTDERTKKFLGMCLTFRFKNRMKRRIGSIDDL